MLPGCALEKGLAMPEGLCCAQEGQNLTVPLVFRLGMKLIASSMKCWSRSRPVEVVGILAEASRTMAKMLSMVQPWALKPNL